MRCFAFGWLAMLLSVVVLLGSASDVEAKGRGWGGSGHGKRSHALHPPTHRVPQHHGRPSTGTVKPQTAAGRKSALTRQRTNEQRKLDHQLSQADHLRSVAEGNGNERLLEAADRMELRAREHYAKRLLLIDGQTGEVPPPADAENGEFADDDAATIGPDSPASLPNDRRHAMRRQQQIEERKLTQRLEQADHLRSIAERNGNERLLKAADRMEENALDHYTSRLDAIERQFDTTRPDRRVRRPLLDEAVDRLHSPVRSYRRGLVWP